MDIVKETVRKAEQIQKKRIIIAIDGRCGSGKTVFAGQLADALQADLLHMDDFFLRPQQRTAERYRTPGENVDHERFAQEVLIPLSEGRDYLYRPFDCQTMKLTDGTMMHPGRITIVEGSYSMHSSLLGYYDLKVFLTVNAEKQMQRIALRNPDKAEDFREKWIPLEEKYFSMYHPMEKADLIFDTSELF